MSRIMGRCMHQVCHLVRQVQAGGHTLEEVDTLGVVRAGLHGVNPDIVPEEGGGGVLSHPGSESVTRSCINL